ncbi:hypothetical protein [Pseudomonas rubra]|uniref:Uncharacterized protein n=1 Tax=Pseudomonas rubra TaxID=2942627 RepID=A0ABT5P6G0_9PSED|nr:hypothetical protein [Pseudomonas rubra]MDD1013880.1 hypothetical protein [Pseudomonas rubra]MDD1038299.1 hypothetical protein [Pseudomonas rubra]MDD1154611.1 hypothetical protein [Pseudomonas rubra]
MTTYSLTGTITDSEGKSVEVGEFTSNANRNARNVEFYTSNGFTGVLTLTLTLTHFDGSKSVEAITLTGTAISTLR